MATWTRLDPGEGVSLSFLETSWSNSCEGEACAAPCTSAGLRSKQRSGKAVDVCEGQRNSSPEVSFFLWLNISFYKCQCLINCTRSKMYVRRGVTLF